MKKTITTFLLILLLTVSFASAKIVDYKEDITITKYYEEENTVVTHRIYANYDNDDRHSTYDYRHGYSYRTTKDYWKNNNDYYIYDLDRGELRKETPNRKYIHSSSEKRSYDEEDYYIRYYPYLKKAEVKKCYNSAPDDKLFYIRCP